MSTGYASHTTRVETWECDFNGHWNTRYYTRAFQNALETIALLDGRSGTRLRTRHIRFHKELLAGDPVLVRSALIQGGRWDGTIAHVLESNGQLSATALDVMDSPARPSPHLPPVAEATVPHALPRGLPGEAPALPAASYGAHLGILRPGSYDHSGALMFDELFRYVSYASFDHHVRLGYTPQFTAQSGMGRMVVEARTTLLGTPPVGTGVQSHSWLTQAQGKTFVSAHHLQTLQGDPIALVELCLVSVDMNTRRAAPVPEFLLEIFKNHSCSRLLHKR